jgi:soluble lytic murein transglycosylase
MMHVGAGGDRVKVVGRFGGVWRQGVMLLLTGCLSLSAVSLLASEEALSVGDRVLAAKQLLDNGEYESASAAIAALKDHPLYPYLRFWQMEKSLDEQSPHDIQLFLDTYTDTPLVSRLRFAWLRHLAEAQRWQDYLDFYRSSRSAEFRCYFHTAQLETGNRDAALNGAKSLWLVGHSQHGACDTLFTAWEDADRLTPALRWQRIRLAMGEANLDLASFLARGLPQGEQQQVALWRSLHEHPHTLAEEGVLQADDPLHREIALHAMHQLARSEPKQAAELLFSIASRFRFEAAERDAITHTIALYLALRGDVRALEWYAVLPPPSFNESSRGWAVRAALRNKRWLAVSTWIEEMPLAERQSEMWSYWLARAYQANGREEEAHALFSRLSTARSYYGFLAADRIGAEYNLKHADLEVDEPTLGRLKAHPGLQRAGELYRLGMLSEARGEWDLALLRMDREERLAAAALAARWQWHDRALLSLARASHFDDLVLRFPLAYGETFTSEAQRQALDPAWIFAVARQESAMDSMARSPVGAMGLMQLMPATGREIARQLDTDISAHDSLLQAQTNIRFGSHYLRQMLERFDNPVMATAAYNAGPHQVTRWYPEQASMDADIWVDTMPFHETREYVRRVMAYAVFYDLRLEQPIQRLAERMPAIGRPQLLAAAE